MLFRQLRKPRLSSFGFLIISVSQQDNWNVLCGQLTVIEIRLFEGYSTDIFTPEPWGEASPSQLWVILAPCSLFPNRNTYSALSALGPGILHLFYILPSADVFFEKTLLIKTLKQFYFVVRILSLCGNKVQSWITLEWFILRNSPQISGLWYCSLC